MCVLRYGVTILHFIYVVAAVVSLELRPLRRLDKEVDLSPIQERLFQIIRAVVKCHLL